MLRGDHDCCQRPAFFIRDATTPPGMCSGFVDTLRDPQAEHLR
jgi:hypothetical protein